VGRSICRASMGSPRTWERGALTSTPGFALATRLCRVGACQRIGAKREGSPVSGSRHWYVVPASRMIVSACAPSVPGNAQAMWAAIQYHAGGLAAIDGPGAQIRDLHRALASSRLSGRSGAHSAPLGSSVSVAAAESTSRAAITNGMAKCEALDMLTSALIGACWKEGLCLLFQSERAESTKS